MKTVLSATIIAVLMVSLGVTSHSQNNTLDGAGASFPYPLYSQWAYKYNQLTGLKINYQSIGSGGGIAQIKARTVDFGASDEPLTEEALNEAGLMQFPLIMGGVVPVINVSGVGTGKLKLTPEILAGIFLGTITKWNDPAITQVNPGLTLPSTAITVVHRSDGSGTTWIFTSYLSKVSTEWNASVGTGKAVAWPTGIGGKGNEGIAAYVQRTNGAIGYVEYAYALQSNLATALLRNRAGNFVEPTIDTFQAAAANIDGSGTPGFYMVLTDQPGDTSWPIAGASFILIHRNQQNPKTAADMLTFFDWCYTHGGDTARELHYVPIPANLIGQVEAAWQASITAAGKPVWDE